MSNEIRGVSSEDLKERLNILPKKLTTLLSCIPFSMETSKEHVMEWVISYSKFLESHFLGLARVYVDISLSPEKGRSIFTATALMVPLIDGEEVTEQALIWPILKQEVGFSD